MEDNKSEDVVKMELEEKEELIEKQARRILSLEGELQQVKQERDDLFRKFTDLSLTISSQGDTAFHDTSVTSVKTRDELYGGGGGSATSTTSSSPSSSLQRRSSQQSSGSGESPRSSKLVSQQSIPGGGGSRVSRQRSFKNASEDVIKRSRAQQATSYQLSQDLHDKQVEMLERKYGGSLRARRAARTIQRAYRHYCMNRNFQKLRHSVGERRLSKRLSELGRSNTIWTDRISANVDDNGNFHPGNAQQQLASAADGNGAAFPHNESFSRDIRKMVADFETGNNRYDHRLYHQMTFDQGVKMDPRHSRGGSPGRRRLERTSHVDGGELSKSKSGSPSPLETNNNRNSYPEQNSGGGEPPQAGGSSESAVDPHSLNFETLLESKETDILTDSFHSDSVHSEGSNHDISNILSNRPSSSSLASSTEYSFTSAGGTLTPSSPYDTYHRIPPGEGPLLPHQGFHSSFSEPHIRVDLASPLEPPLPYDQLPPLPQDQVVKYYMNTQVKLRTRKPGEPSPPPEAGVSSNNSNKQKPVPPVRAPESSPIWKRKGGGAGSGGSGGSGSTLAVGPTPQGGQVVNGSVASVKAEMKRMSNISETSEPESFDGQCSSSPSSENISTENISLASDSSISYQRKLRMSITPDQHGSNTVPRPNDKQRKRLYRIGLNLFNKKPEKGLDFLLDQGFVEGSPRSVAHFFITRKGLSKQMIGEFLGNLQKPFNMEVLHFFTQEIDLAGLAVDVALRKFQGYFRMPGEAQKIERLMEAFADRFCQCNPDQVKNFKTSDTVFLLAFAIIMLNTDLHNSSVKPEKKMKVEDFIKNLRGIDDGDDLDPDLLAGIYERIKGQEFRAGVDQVTQVMKVEQTIVGKKPQLGLPHRRLVCYCRLYEVHDPNKKEKIGLHQREVFLFNDLILVTKIFSKKKTGITYNFKTSLSLCGMQVYLFETPHYQYGIQLTNNLDGKPLITFNARNDHDRQKFVEDLKESILETNGMEQLRIEEEMHKHRTSHNTLDKHYANDDSRVHMYELAKPADPSSNRLSAPECGLKKTPLSNSLTDLCAAPGMRRGNSGASLDSGVVSGSVGSSGSRDDSAGLSPQPVPAPARPRPSTSKAPPTPPRVKPRTPIMMRPGLPDGTEV
ncbi:LOW QUALITY PROTEIN: IQ motif and SEC7 domain-containing protein 1-like [Littorina saxatilis]|uniref:LOW QUALITY PROTEIN: IQ motif and SEC7 domain-containing protein 1-like n=1 Tax=Littorina saxatilis TaxID=31220 RepID=UPI0038B4A6B3